MENNPNQGTNFGRWMAAGMASNCIMRIISFVVILGFWGLAYFIFSKNHWLINVASNLRGPIIIAAFILPIIIVAVIDYFLRKYLYRKI